MIKENDMSVEIKLGEFVSKSGAILVIDPCYQRTGYEGSNCAMICRQGTYEAFVVKSSANRIEEISIYFAGMNRSVEWRLAESPFIGVDSGQTGFFDFMEYPEEEVGDFWDLNSFYGQVCHLTLSDGMAGVIPFGAVSSSGWGDGVYSLYVVKDETGVIVAAKVVFIDDAEDDSDEEEFYEDEDELLYDED
jgi:hypothetical protein